MCLRRLAVVAGDIYYATGKSLGRPIKGPTDRDNKQSMRLVLNEYLKHDVLLSHDEPL